MYLVVSRFAKDWKELIVKVAILSALQLITGDMAVLAIAVSINFMLTSAFWHAHKC